MQKMILLHSSWRLGAMTSVKTLKNPEKIPCFAYEERRRAFRSWLSATAAQALISNKYLNRDSRSRWMSRSGAKMGIMHFPSSVYDAVGEMRWLMAGRFGFYSTLLLGLLGLGLWACSRQSDNAKEDRRLPVVASILPLADFARQVGGDRVRVEVLVPAGASPHTYELAPAQLKAVTRARVLVLNGVGLEFWADKVISSADNPDLIVVTASEEMKIISGDADEPGGNPHTWLSPQKAMIQVERIREAFAKADPAGAETYRDNADRFQRDLRALDQDIRSAVAGFSSRKFIAFHAAWSYFASDYGLEETSVIERRPGQEPSPAEIADIIRKANEIKARAIFAEPQFSTKAAETIAGECGARVLLLNPLGHPPDYRYLDLMRFNLSQMSLALR
jgi:ABC-type Zn uptake system ZnuABC Zn-binding protein ZnuA